MENPFRSGQPALLIVGIYLAISVLFFSHLLYGVWSAAAGPYQAVAASQSNGTLPVRFWLLGETPLSPPAAQFLLVLFLGALGSTVHGATSYVTYAGRGSLSNNWIAWYLFKPVVGMGMALLFYFVFGAGLLSSAAGENHQTAVLAISGLAGLFSDQASLKLREIARVLFSSSDTRQESPGSAGLRSVK